MNKVPNRSNVIVEQPAKKLYRKAESTNLSNTKNFKTHEEATEPLEKVTELEEDLHVSTSQNSNGKNVAAGSHARDTTTTHSSEKSKRERVSEGDRLTY